MCAARSNKIWWHFLHWAMHRCECRWCPEVAPLSGHLLITLYKTGCKKANKITHWLALKIFKLCTTRTSLILLTIKLMMTELTCKILTEKYMYHYQKWEYRILEYTLSNLLKYSLLTTDIKMYNKEVEVEKKKILLIELISLSYWFLK